MRNPFIISRFIMVVLMVGFTVIIVGGPLAFIVVSNENEALTPLFLFLMFLSPFVGAFFAIQSVSWGAKLTAWLWSARNGHGRTALTLLTHSNMIVTVPQRLGKNFNLMVAMCLVLTQRTPKLRWRELAFSVTGALEDLGVDVPRTNATVSDLVAMFDTVSGGLQHFERSRVGEAARVTALASLRGWTPEALTDAFAAHSRKTVLTALERNVPLEYASV